MPHGFKRDVTATKALFANGFFVDRGSFLSLPDSSGMVHVRMEGMDRAKNRELAIRLARGKCSICGKAWPDNLLELHHPGKCDCTNKKCPNRVEIRCSQFVGHCHKHFSPNFKRKAQAARDFDKVMGEDKP